MTPPLQRRHLFKGFTLIELLSVMVIVGIMSVVLMSRLGGTTTAHLLGGRDDVIAALSFAQQTAMARDGISVVFTNHSVSVNENGNPITLVGSNYYPLSLPSDISIAASANQFVFDRLGRTTPGSVILNGSGASGGASATIQIDASGYAYAN